MRLIIVFVLTCLSVVGLLADNRALWRPEKY